MCKECFNVERGCSHTELLIVSKSNKLVYFISRITAVGNTKLHCIFHCSLTDKTRALIQVHPDLQEASLKK